MGGGIGGGAPTMGQTVNAIGQQAATPSIMPTGPTMADTVNAIGQQAATPTITPRQTFLNRIGTRAGQIQGYANKLQPVINAIPGMQQGQGQDRTQQQQQRYPVNFNVSPAPYIAPPGAGSNNNYGY